MSVTTFPDATVELLDYQQFLEYAANSLNYSGQTEMLNHVSQRLRSMPYNPSSSLTTKEQWAEQIMYELRSNGYEIQYNGNNQWTGTVFPNTAQVSATNPVNSNIVNVSRGRVRSWYGGLNEVGSTGMQTWVPQRMPVSGGLGSKAMYFLGSIGSGVAAASTGIWLGKTFDKTLYDAFPSFWNDLGMNTLDPETWGGIIEGTDSPFAGLMNFILGVDGQNGNAQAYMDENALAYLAYCMYQNGIFSSGASNEITDYVVTDSITLSSPIYWATANCNTYAEYSSSTYYYYDSNICMGFYNNYPIYLANRSTAATFRYSTFQNDSHIGVCVASENNINPVFIYVDTSTGRSLGSTGFGASNTTLNNHNYYYAGATSVFSGLGTEISPLPLSADNRVNNNFMYYAYSLLYNDYRENSSAPDGIGNQDGATLPDTTGWDDLSNVLPSLQQQYPDAFQNPMVWNTDTPYDDTAGNQTRYIPVPFPFANSATDTQPISGTQTQTNTSLNTTPQEILDWLTKNLQQTDTQPATPPANPVDTGTGGTPVPTAPTGSASALWSVYHPTQAQVNSFGAWLWGSPFLTNIGKLFQNPIEGVISLHKVFVPPVDSGTGNIVVGTLDSGVSSATVNEQYVEIDCGSVTLGEDFGNVFDYEPYTKIALYLPFVGIVPLNVADVMRSTIDVKYGVDIFTGACIAVVGVSRDGNDAVLYQYSGNCAVHYPLSNVQQSQLLSGLITVAAGVGAIVATGGAAAPAAATGIAGGAMSALHSNVGRSGGFSANAGAMGIKVPYLIIERPQTKVADTFPQLIGYPTNYSIKLGDCSGHVVVKHVHVEGINATENELEQIESLLHSGVLV